MPVNKTEAEKHREVQDRPSYRRKCSVCGREYYDSVVGPCPERDGRQWCMYCCRICPEHYSLPGQIGQRCRAKDRARAEKRGFLGLRPSGGGDLSGAAAPPPLSGEARTGKERSV